MARLHNDEIAHYRREGWVVPRYRLPAERVARMVDALEALLRANPGVRPEKTPWHQDGHYWPIRPLATCTVWVALEPSKVENGCLRRPLWLVRGVDRSGRNDFAVGH